MSKSLLVRGILKGSVTAALVLSLTGSVSAQEKKSESGVIRLEETVIEGRVQKPNAFFITSRQQLAYDIMEINESFVEEIAKAVEKGPF